MRRLAHLLGSDSLLCTGRVHPLGVEISCVPAGRIRLGVKVSCVPGERIPCKKFVPFPRFLNTFSLMTEPGNPRFGFISLALSIILAQSAGLIGSLATRPNIDTWYRMIEKPFFTPPDWVFPVVWPSLYLLMGIAAWLVYRTCDSEVNSSSGTDIGLKKDNITGADTGLQTGASIGSDAGLEAGAISEGGDGSGTGMIPSVFRTRKRPSRVLALQVYGIHLLVNTAWSFLFFGLKMPGVALAGILLLLVMILLTADMFYRIRPSAGYLMIPYLIWVSYATVLNGSIWWLN